MPMNQQRFLETLSKNFLSLSLESSRVIFSLYFLRMELKELISEIISLTESVI